jgi:signal transduction histidine kinase
LADDELDSQSALLHAPEISAASLRELLDAGLDGVAKIDRSWTVTYMNAAALRMVAANGNPLGKNFWDQYPQTVYPDSPWLKHYCMAMYEGVASEFEQFYPDPLTIWLKLVARPISDGIVIFFQDIKREKQLADALLQNERLATVGRLTTSIAHEIHNPLESVTNLLYLARRSKTTSEVSGYLETAEQELRRASVIASQTLRFSRQNTNPTVVRCDELLRDVLLLQQSRLIGAKITVDTRDLTTVQVLCHEGEVRQILNNLITNAIDAMSEEGGRLVLRSRELPGNGRQGALMTVADTGTGMPRRILQKSFEPFFTTKGNNGNGLGLWVSREIAQRHGGSLKAKSSQSPGHHGSVFQLFLPFVSRLH